MQRQPLQNTYRTIGLLMIVAAIALLIPYTALTMMFEYPDILRQDTSTVLTKFHEGGGALIGTWFAFALTGLPLLPALILLGRKLEDVSPLVHVATVIGVAGMLVQMIGLLRWTFVVPVLADTFVTASDEATKAAAIVAFRTIHQFAGVVLGEHLGQLFTIVWTVSISYVLSTVRGFPTWVRWFGYAASFIYLLAQAELFGTVIAGFPVLEMAGFIGSTLWLVWLVITGSVFVRKYHVLG